LNNKREVSCHLRGWIVENLEELKAVGFTEKELFKHGLPMGIAHLKLLGKDRLSIQIIGQSISISWVSPTGQQITQTAHPENKQWN